MGAEGGCDYTQQHEEDLCEGTVLFHGCSEVT